MKRFFIFFIIISLALSASSQIVNIPDPNFKAALLTHNPVIDLNTDGQIQVSEATAFTGTMNVTSKNIADMTGVEAFVNMKTLNCYQNQITSLNVSSLTALENLWCGSNKLSSLSVSNLPQLKTIRCFVNLITNISVSNLPLLSELQCSSNQLTSLNVSGLPALKILDCRTNQINSLSLNNLPNLSTLFCSSNQLSILPLNNVPSVSTLDCSSNLLTGPLSLNVLQNLRTLYCNNNQITSLQIFNPAIIEQLNCSYNQISILPANLTALKTFNCSDNLITSLSLNSSNQLTHVDFSRNQVTSFTLTNKPQLKELWCRNNLLTSFTSANLPVLEELRLDSNRLTSLSLNNFPALKELICDHNLLTSFTVSNMPVLRQLYCQHNQLTTLSITDLPALEWLSCSRNQLTSLLLNNLPALTQLSCGHNQLSSLVLPPLPLLDDLGCGNNQLTSLSLTNYTKLRYLTCDHNKLSSLTLTNLPLLGNLQCQNNLFTSLTISNLPALYSLHCSNNNITSLSLSALPGLTYLLCDTTLLSSLDLSNFPVRSLRCRGNPFLTYINLKNGAICAPGYPLLFNSNVQTICGDDNELPYISTVLNNQFPNHNISITSFCSVSPAGYNTITGLVRFDGNANGCNNLDSAMHNRRIDITDGTQSGHTFTNQQGKYTFLTGLNNHTVISQADPWFNSSPASHTVNFTTYGNVFTADFCLAPVGVHPDLEIVLIPVTAAMPGSNAGYKLIYTNKGNQSASGTVTLTYDNNKLVFVSADPVVTSQGTGSLSWSYTDLSPYVTRVINIVFQVNPPPIANAGDLLGFVATINPVNGDETPNDNIFELSQLMVNSYDPNDKQVLEGSQLPIEKLNNYLHYVVRFQNTGTANAINVTIRDTLSSNLDWNSFVPVIASHNYRANITKGNAVEFIFNSINLPPLSINEPASHGFISFMIKPKNTLAAGDSITNKAAIYFDFNAPIVTNTVTTKIIKPVGNSNPDLVIYSNPAKDQLNFSVKSGVQIRSVRLININGQDMGIKTIEIGATHRRSDVSRLPSGLYFLEVNTGTGRTIGKIVIVK